MEHESEKNECRTKKLLSKYGPLRERDVAEHLLKFLTSHAVMSILHKERHQILLKYLEKMFANVIITVQHILGEEEKTFRIFSSQILLPPQAFALTDILPRVLKQQELSLIFCQLLSPIRSSFPASFSFEATLLWRWIKNFSSFFWTCLVCEQWRYKKV